MAFLRGRFAEDPDSFTFKFGASLEVDKALAAYDIAGSRAHAQMLCEQGIISETDFSAIDTGLAEIEREIADGCFVWSPEDEDIHMAVERALTERIGEAGGRLHTARSRNDQVALDLRLCARELCRELKAANAALREELIRLAKKHLLTIMPGYTHLQHAQPVLFSHHLMAYFWMFSRDFLRLDNAADAADENPLGAAALAGSSYPVDRAKTADLLQFARVCPNSMDAVSDRDFLLDMLYACSVSMIHLSRLSEELVLWSSEEFGFIELSDSYSTGSSIMPQKKNPDFAELIRGKTGRVSGDLLALLMTLKSLPLAYNKDLQECKEGPLDAAHTLLGCYSVMTGMLASMTVCVEVMEESACKGYAAATDLADYLAKKGLPFREAHGAVAALVRRCAEEGRALEELSLDELRAVSELFEKDVLERLSARAVVEARRCYGGTASASVAAQIAEAEAQLDADKNLC